MDVNHIPLHRENVQGLRILLVQQVKGDTSYFVGGKVLDWLKTALIRELNKNQPKKLHKRKIQDLSTHHHRYGRHYHRH